MHRVQEVIQGHKDPKVFKDPKDVLVLKEIKGQRAVQEKEVFKEPKVIKVNKDVKEKREI